MAITLLNSISIKINLNNGYNSANGNIQTVPVYLGPLNHAHYDPDKVLAIVDGLERCLSKTVSSVQEVRTSTLYED